MIHQFIFAAPRPGLTEKQFQEYWLNVHAVNFASKIPQIKKYQIGRRLPKLDQSESPLWNGVAEIWLRNDEDQIASLQTEEFIKGARADEPNWAAFWRSLVLDTEDSERFQYCEEPETGVVKLLVLGKRLSGMSLNEFREESRIRASEAAGQLFGLVSYAHYFTRDAVYSVGEAPLDVVHALRFRSPNVAHDALSSGRVNEFIAALHPICEERYNHRIVVDENWVIGPEERE
ncbi:EthD domain-containing protein [uncultured Campylobacter sp.]|jgi:hypothetical protein|uniref:EthD domain-containing protein n=1 Tax=uncultured Campylobacter sp. TaxID=218934 RepID=UPI00261BF446|nr:EthD domain-containing protein [uncultured Campylobacter sp.]